MTLLQPRPDEVKCVVVGDDAVGKTSMLMGYATSRYPTSCVPSVFDNYAGCLKISGKSIQMQIIDTMEEDQDLNKEENVFRGADVFVVCFSVICPKSLQNVEETWVPAVLAHAPNAPFILVGAQADLRASRDIAALLASRGEQFVTYEEGEAAARRLGAACYIETSPEVETRVRKLINGAIASVLRIRGSRQNACSIL